MNVQEAKIVAAELTAKINAGGMLTEEEQNQRTAATAVLLAAAETNQPGSTDRIRAQVEDQLNDRVPAGKVKYLGLKMSPGLKVLASGLTYIGVAALGAVAGVKFEQRRTSKRNALSLTNDTNQASDSPQSHPATSPLDGRHFNHAGNPGNEGNTTNHPGPTAGRGRASTVH